MTATHESLSHNQAIALLQDMAQPLNRRETQPLAACYGRILAEDLVAQRDVPAFDNSAMDGFALGPASCENPLIYQVVGTTFAGDNSGPTLMAGEARRIFTGAPVPGGCVGVVPQEDCQFNEESVTLSAAVHAGANIRQRGEDVRAGATVLARGTVLRAPEVAQFAAEGRVEIEVYAPVKVGVFSTGNELVQPGAQAEAGQIYDANRYLLFGALNKLPVELVDLGILPDDGAAVRSALHEAASSFDVLLTSGGAGQGKADYVSAAIAELGELNLWHLAIKPGRPFMAGQIGACLLLGLPGNPVAALVSFLTYARPVLLALAGAGFIQAEPLLVPAGFQIGNRKTGRREFLRARLLRNAEGQQVAEKYARDGSALLSSLSFAEGLIIIEEEIAEVRAGDLLPFVSFAALGL